MLSYERGSPGLITLGWFTVPSCSGRSSQFHYLDQVKLELSLSIQVEVAAPGKAGVVTQCTGRGGSSSEWIQRIKMRCSPLDFTHKNQYLSGLQPNDKNLCLHFQEPVYTLFCIVFVSEVKKPVLLCPQEFQAASYF